MVIMKKRTAIRLARTVSNRVRGISALSPYGFGQALGLTSLIGMVLLAVVFWFGGYDASVIISQFPVEFSFDDWTILIGIAQTYVIGYIGGWIFAKLYNRHAR